MEELGRLTAEEFQKADKNPIVIVLDDVRSILNVGSVFRTADAFRVQAIHLCGIAPIPVKEMRKTALGATEAVDWQHFENVEISLQKLKKEGFEIIAIEQTDSSISLENYSFSNTKKYAFIFGHEVTGVSEAAIRLCDAAIEIPQFGTKHSLNISVSAGIVMWQAVQPFLK